MWLEQILAARGRTGAFHDGKRQAARFFYRHELPRTDAQMTLLASLDRTALDMRGRLVLTGPHVTPPAPGRGSR